MSFIQNLYTSRDNNANAATYVGQEGRLWYNPTDNTIYVSDGNTAGGIPVTVGGGGNATFNVVTANVINTGAEIVQGNIVIATSATLGNLVITDQAIFGNVANRNITIDPAGNGLIELLGPLHIHATGNIELEPEFAVGLDGQTAIRVPVSDNNQGALEIIGSTSGAVVPLGNPGGMIHVTGQNNEVSRIYNDSVNNYSLYVGRRYNGTAAAPTGVLANQVISRLGANPYLVDTAGFAPLGTARIDFIATENQTTTAQGTRIVMNVTPGGSVTQATVASFDTSGIELTGNLVPFTDNIYSLGNVTNRWIGAYFGNAGIYIEDTTLGTTGSLALDNGTLDFNNIDSLKVGNLQFTRTGIITNIDPTQDVLIGQVGDTGNTVINNNGLKFPDATVQSTAAIPLIQRGNANGVATLDGSGKVPAAQLPAGATVYLGAWNASTNTPTLADGTGSAGDEYSVSVGGTVNLGSGPITFTAGDFVIYSGTVWQQIPTAIGVTSFNTRQGAVTLTSGDVTNALSAGSIVNSKLANSNVTITSGVGLSGGQVVPLGGTITLTNTGVTAAVGGTGVAVSAATGNITFSIGQSVATNATVQFGAISSTTTVQATGNVTGGNIATGGRVVATGNIVTSGYLLTPNTSINNGIVTTGNISGGNLAITGAGTIGTTLGVTGNITGGNVSATNYTGLVTHSIREAGTVSGGTVTLNMTTDDIVRCTFANAGMTVAFSNIIPGRTVTLLARKTDGGTDTVNTGIVAQNMSTGDETVSVDGVSTVVLTYYSLGTTTADIYCSMNYRP
jgi:hypothetical protein